MSPIGHTFHLCQGRQVLGRSASLDVGGKRDVAMVEGRRTDPGSQSSQEVLPEGAGPRTAEAVQEEGHQGEGSGGKGG